MAQQKRQTAYKTRIKDLTEGSYVKEEGWNPNYVECNGRKISRVNIIATVVSKEDLGNFQSVVLDDGTAKIAARTFEKNENVDLLDIGDVVLVIGRPREYGNERYVLIEIIRKIENKKWILYRKAELDNQSFEPEQEEEKKEDANNKDVVEESVVENNEDENKDDKNNGNNNEDAPNSEAETVLKRIKELDSGEGADFDEVIKGIETGEKIISNLLSDGEIFEVSPGKLKLLE